MDFDEIRHFMMSEDTLDIPIEYKRLSSEPWSDVSGYDLLHDAAEVDLGVATSEFLDDRMTRSLELSSLPTHAGQDPFCEDDWCDFGSQSASNTPSHGSTASRSWGSSRAAAHGRLNGIISGRGRPHVLPANLSQPAQETESDSGETLKTKLLSAWNNMKFGMKMKTNFKYDSEIWLLGKCYQCSHAEKEEQKKRGHSTNLDRFRRDFHSRPWFTYRRDFPPLPGSQFTTDVGWGCMLRTGQMMLAQAFVMHFLGKEWTWGCQSQHRLQESIFHRQIIRFFGDMPGIESPFSIHRLVEVGAETGKKPGDWYGPASVAYVLRDAMEIAPECNPLLGQICLYVSQDCTIYKQDVVDLCTRRPSSSRQESHSSNEDVVSSDAGEAVEEHWRAMVLLIPVRLGGETLNSIYTPCVQALLQHPLCLGIIGGRPKHSVYFVGWQEDKLIYTDPHLCQDLVDVRHRDFPLQTFHCMSPRKMAFNRMDPSCTIGFYCKSKADFFHLIVDSQEMAKPPNEVGIYPIFVFSEGRSIDLANAEAAKQSQPERYLRIRHMDKNGQIRQPSKDSEDFVFL